MKKILTALLSAASLMILTAMNVFADLLPESNPTSTGSGSGTMAIIIIVIVCVVAAALAVILIKGNKKS